MASRVFAVVSGASSSRRNRRAKPTCGEFEPFRGGHIDYAVPQADWITILEGASLVINRVPGPNPHVKTQASIANHATIA